MITMTEKVTLRQLALMWVHDEITMSEARKQAQELEYPKPVTDPDGTLWISPEELIDNHTGAVENLAGTDGITSDKIHEFLTHVFETD